MYTYLLFLLVHFILQIGQAIIEAGDNDKKKRERLAEMLKRLEEIVSIKDETKKREMVAHFLETEGTTTDLEEDCRERIADLQGKECVILVAGTVYKMSRLVGKPTMWFPNRSDTNQPVQTQKRARSLKFRI